MEKKELIGVLNQKDALLAEEKELRTQYENAKSKLEDCKNKQRDLTERATEYEENKPCVEVLKKWIDGGVGVVLDTMRTGDDLKTAVKWCEDHGIELYGVGQDPFQHEWGASPHKAWGVFSVDDRNLGVPLKQKAGERLMVDWDEIDRLYSEGILHMAAQYKDQKR